MVQHGADGMFPVVVEGEPAQSAGPALSGTVEGDDVEAGGGDSLPDGVELFDQRVEATVQQDRATRRTPSGKVIRR